MTLSKRKLGDPDDDRVIRGAEAVSLVDQLTKASYAWGGKDAEPLPRGKLPYRFIRGKRT